MKDEGSCGWIIDAATFWSWPLLTKVERKMITMVMNDANKEEDEEEASDILGINRYHHCVDHSLLRQRTPALYARMALPLTSATKT